jgi:hypothetical protein
MCPLRAHGHHRSSSGLRHRICNPWFSEGSRARKGYAGTTETRRRHARSSTPSRTRRLRAVLRRLRWPNVDVDGRRPGAPVRGGDFKVKESPSRRKENTPARGQPPEHQLTPACAANTPRGTASPDRLWAHPRGRGAPSLDLVGKPDPWLTPLEAGLTSLGTTLQLLTVGDQLGTGTASGASGERYAPTVQRTHVRGTRRTPLLRPS